MFVNKFLGFHSVHMFNVPIEYEINHSSEITKQTSFSYVHTVSY